MDAINNQYETSVKSLYKYCMHLVKNANSRRPIIL